MSSSNISEFSRFVKQCKIKEKKFYLLQGDVFDYILTNDRGNKNIEFQRQCKLDHVDIDVFEIISSLLVKDNLVLLGCVYWVSE